MIQTCANTCWNNVEMGVLPLPEENQHYLITKIALITFNAIQAIASLPFAICFSILSSAQAIILRQPSVQTLDKKAIHPVPLPEALGKTDSNKFKLVGATTAYYQTEGAEGCPKSTWKRREDELVKQGYLNPKNRSGFAVDLMGDHDQIIKLLKEANLNAFRFSVDWSVIEPKKGQLNPHALLKYRQLCEKLLENGITPMVTLHHFNDPIWFANEGGFENEKNIVYFERFCEKVASLTPRGVKHFCTINEPNIYTFLGYILGWAPPGKSFNFSLGAKVFNNLLKAHQVAYDAIKKVRPKAQVGLSHQYLRFEAGSYLTKIACKYLNAMINEPFLQVLKTGKARIQIPFLANHKIELKEKLKLDFLGAQFYSVPYITLKGSVARRGETMTEMQYPTHPEVAYEALKELHAACPDVPIFITESGIAPKIPEQRAPYLSAVLGYIGQAVMEGVIVLGYFVWSLTDNWEWPTEKKGGGFSKHFGMYAFNPQTREFTLRKGTEPITTLAEKLREAPVHIEVA